MKKIFIAIAFCAMSLIACNKQQIDNNVESSSSYAVIRAIGEAYDLVGEEAVTKATINSSEQIVWASGDEIGVRLYKGSAVTGHDDGSGYDAWDATFTLDAADAGKTNGSFTCPTSTDQWLKAYAAWYPRYIDTDLTNIGGDAKLYFYLRSWYDGYTDGTSLMPMLADMSSWSESNTDISFKHVGAGVRVTLKDVPGAANQASLTVAGKNIAGWYTVEDPTTAGTAKLVAGDGTDNNTVYLKFATASAKRDMTFIFPLPTVDLSGGITIKLYYDSDHKEFWSRSASNINVSLDRGEVLDMPDLTVPVDPATASTATVNLWFIPKKDVTNGAYLNCWDFSGDWPGLEMTEYTEVNHVKCYKLPIEASKVWGKTRTFKFVDKDTWSSNSTTFTFTKYKTDYYFEAGEGEDLVQVNRLPKPVTISIDGTFTDWAPLTGNTVTSTNYKSTMKAFSDGTSLAIYVKVEQLVDGKYDLSSADWMRLYFDKDNDKTTGSTLWYNEGADDIDDNNNDFRLKIVNPGYGFRGILQSTGTTYNPAVSIVENTTEHYFEMEIKFDIAALGHVTPTTTLADKINIFCLGYGPSEFSGKIKNVIL